MKSAKLKTSHRLQRVLAVLSDGQEHSTRDIVYAADVCAVNSIIAELRANGVGITCKRRGRNVFLYRLASASSFAAALGGDTPCGRIGA